MDPRLATELPGLSLLSTNFPLLCLYAPFMRSAFHVMKEQALSSSSRWSRLASAKIPGILAIATASITSLPTPTCDSIATTTTTTQEYQPKAPVKRETLSERYDTSHPTMSLLCLPAELHIYVASHLPADALLALRLTSTYFYYTLLRPLPSPSDDSLTSCQRFAIRRMLDAFTKDISPKQETVNESSAGHSGPSLDGRTSKRCILCKSLYPTYMFSSHHSPACFIPPSSPSSPHPASTIHQEIIRLPKDVCAWHVGRLARVVLLERSSSLSDAQPRSPGWYASREMMCTHCGDISWSQRNTLSGNNGRTSVSPRHPTPNSPLSPFNSSPSPSPSPPRTCTCDCDSCPLISVTAYTRYITPSEQRRGECRSWRFWRDQNSGVLYVRENRDLLLSCRTGSSGGAEEVRVRDIKVSFTGLDVSRD